MRIFTALILILMIGRSSAQLSQWIETSETHAASEGLAIGVLPGYLIAHRSDLKNLESHNIGLELNWERAVFSAQWAKHYKDPVIGYGLTYNYLGKEETGHALSFNGNFKFGLFQISRNTTLNVRLSAGLGFVSRRFDPLNNRRNQAIGSNANAYLQTSGYLSRSFNQGILDYGVALSHFSNAAYTAPNLGYNMPSFVLRWSMRKASNAVSEPSLKADTSYVSERWSWSANTVFGVKERNFAKPIKFTPWGLMLRGMRVSNPIRRWRFGLDMIADKTYAYQLDNQRDLSTLSFSEQFELGLAAGHEWRVANLRLMLEAGYYLSKPAAFKNPMYQRMGFLYNATDQWGVHATLKFHRGVADYMEWGLCYTINAK